VDAIKNLGGLCFVSSQTLAQYEHFHIRRWTEAKTGEVPPVLGGNGGGKAHEED